MDEATARAMIQAHFDASGVGAAGGAPEDDIARASEIYADDAVVEWPQGGERVRGKANIIAFRSTYPTRQQFELHRTTGCHDLWVNEYTIRYDDRPVMVVGIMEFRDGQGRPRADLLRRAVGAAGLAGAMGRAVRSSGAGRVGRPAPRRRRRPGREAYRDVRVLAPLAGMNRPGSFPPSGPF